MIFRTIRTGLYGKTAENLLWRVFKMFRQNFSAFEYRGIAKAGSVVSDVNGEVLIKFDDSPRGVPLVYFPYELQQPDDAVALDYLALALDAAFPSAESGKEEFSCLADILRRAPDVEIKHEPALVRSIIGEELDPFLAEAERRRREELDTAASDFAAKIVEIRDDYDGRILSERLLAQKSIRCIQSALDWGETDPDTVREYLEEKSKITRESETAVAALVEDMRSRIRAAQREYDKKLSELNAVFGKIVPVDPAGAV